MLDIAERIMYGIRVTTKKENSMIIPFKVTFNKYVLSGMAEGLTIKETMKFVDWDDACSWAAAVTESFSVNFVILDMWGPNDEYEEF